MRSWLAVIGLAVLLSACFPPPPPPTVIGRFEPGRGPGGVYGVGEELRFWVWLNGPGYFTLSIVEPNGQISLLDNLYLEAGTQILPPPGAGYLYRVARAGSYQARLAYADRSNPSNIGATVATAFVVR